MTWLKTAFILIVSIYVLVCVIMFVLQRSFLYFPDPSPLSEIEIGSEWQRVSTETADGLTLNHFYRPAADGSPTMLLFHGNAGNIGLRLEKFASLEDFGVGAFLTEYRGFGGNPGKPTEQGLYADARSAIAWLSERGVQPNDIVLYGASLGSGVATAMAAEQATLGTPVAGVILEAPYTSIAETAQYHYPYLPAKWLARDRYDSLNRIDRIEAPLLILHGKRDTTIPIELGRELFEAAIEPKTFIALPNAAHSYLLRENAAKQAMRDFVRLNAAEAPSP